MEFIEWVLTFIVIFVSIVGIILVLIQSSHGGGGLFGDVREQNIVGSQGKSDLLTRLTYIFIGIFIFGSFFVAYLKYRNSTVLPVPMSQEPITQPQLTQPQPSLLEEKDLSSKKEKDLSSKKESIKKDNKKSNNQN